MLETSSSNIRDDSDPSIPVKLRKVVAARRTERQVISGSHLDSLQVLEALQEKDSTAYQLLLRLPSGATFLSCTPERLYSRRGVNVASEAVAGTRPRGTQGNESLAKEANKGIQALANFEGCH